MYNIIVVVGTQFMILSESEEPPTMYHRVILSLLNVNWCWIQDKCIPLYCDTELFWIINYEKRHIGPKIR